MTAEYQKIPALVDPHVHLREPGAEWKESFRTGSMAAIAGGYEVVLDMPNNPGTDATTTPEALYRKWRRTEDGIFCDVGFHLGATAKNSEYFNMVKSLVFGLKIYMNHTTGDLLMEDPNNLQRVFERWPRGKPIMVHAEGETLEKAINLARLNNQILHVAHVATAEEVGMIRKAKEAGLPVTCEVTPHHLFLTEADEQYLGPFGKMRPPLGTAADQFALWQYLHSGVIDMIATDHAPHTRKEKLSDNPPFGVPGLETTLPLLLTAIAEQRLSLEDVVRLTSTNPRKIFGLPKATDESYVLLDLEHSGFISSDNLRTKCGWTPFEGVRVTGRIAKVVFKGHAVFDGENVVGEPRGEVIFPER